MSKSFVPHRSTLPESQQRLWRALKPVTDLGFILYGGTAIALQLGHRISVDFDFFTSKPFGPVALKQSLPFLASAVVVSEGPNTLTVITSAEEAGGGVKLSFFGDLAFVHDVEPLSTDDDVLRVASLNELMATKLKVLFDRVEEKDYLDLAAMLRHGINLRSGLDRAVEIFGNAFQRSEALKAMTYFADEQLASLSERDRQTLIGAAKAIQPLRDHSR